MNIILSIIIIVSFLLLIPLNTKIDDFQEYYNVWCVPSTLVGYHIDYANSENFKLSHCQDCKFFKDDICKHRHHWGYITDYTIKECTTNNHKKYGT